MPVKRRKITIELLAPTHEGLSLHCENRDIPISTWVKLAITEKLERESAPLALQLDPVNRRRLDDAAKRDGMGAELWARLLVMAKVRGL
jgi:hypothetical protein